MPIVSRAVPESRSTSNGTFKTKKVGEVKLSFVEYSASKKVHLHPDIVEYPRGGPQPLYDLLIIGKQTLHDIGTVLDFKEKTITIDEILLPNEKHQQSAAQTKRFQGAKALFYLCKTKSGSGKINFNCRSNKFESITMYCSNLLIYLYI
jgi:hypothetical protein